MAAQVHYVRFASTQDRVAQEWLRATQLIVESGTSALVTPPPDRGRAGSVVGWRLVSENHREIARGSRLHPSDRAAGFDAATLARRATELIVHAARQHQTRTSRWFAVLDDDIVLVGSRAYENRVTARNAGALAVRSLAILGAGADMLSMGQVPPEGEPAT